MRSQRFNAASKMLLGPIIGPIIGIGMGATAAASLGQDLSSAQQLQRTARLGELEQLRLDTRLRVNPDIPPGQRLFFDYGAYFTASYLTVDDSAGDSHALRQYDFQPYARLNIDGVHEFFVRGRFGYLDFNNGDSFDGRGDEPIDGDLDRVYYRFDAARFLSAYKGAANTSKLTFQVGRDFSYWGNGLVLAQTLDGGSLSIGNDLLTLDVVAGVTPTRTVDIDTSRPNFDHNTNRGFYGAMLSADLGDHRPYIYGLVQRDYNEDKFRRVSLLDTRYNYNSFYIGAGSTGAIGSHLRYGVEGVYEFGNTKSNSFTLDGFGIFPVDQSNDSIKAFAIDARLDYFLLDPNQTRLSGEFILSSGDRDRGTTTNTFNGNFPNTDDNAFNAFGLINTGLAFAPSVSNLVALRLGAATFPLPMSSWTRKLQVGTDFFVLGKYDANAPIDEGTGGHHYLGVESDLYLNWQVTSDITLALRYGLFLPSHDNDFANDDPRQLFYAGVTFAL